MLVLGVGGSAPRRRRGSGSRRPWSGGGGHPRDAVFPPRSAAPTPAARSTVGGRGHRAGQGGRAAHAWCGGAPASAGLSTRVARRRTRASPTTSPRSAPPCSGGGGAASERARRPYAARRACPPPGHGGARALRGRDPWPHALGGRRCRRRLARGGLRRAVISDLAVTFRELAAGTDAFGELVRHEGDAQVTLSRADIERLQEAQDGMRRARPASRPPSPRNSQPTSSSSTPPPFDRPAAAARAGPRRASTPPAAPAPPAPPPAARSYGAALPPASPPSGPDDETQVLGSHVIVYSRDAEADRAFFADVLDEPHVDAGGGWLIFKVPPAELAVHPSDGPTGHELYFMCDPGSNDERATDQGRQIHSRRFRGAVGTADPFPVAGRWRGGDVRAPPSARDRLECGRVSA